MPARKFEGPIFVGVEAVRFGYTARDGYLLGGSSHDL